MLSRIFWVLLAGVAFIGGLAVQGNAIFSLGDDADNAREQAIEQRVESAIESRFEDHMTVVGADGEAIDISPQTKRELGRAVGRLAAAKTQAALLRARGADDHEIAAAELRSEKASAEVDRLKAEIDRQEALSQSDRDALRTQIREEIRDAVRSTVRN